MKAWHSSITSLLLLTCLTACNGGTEAENAGEVIPPPPPSSSSSGGGSSSGGSSGGGGIATLHEDFGDGQFTNFDEADTEFFFSQEYKALETTDPEDPHPAFYHPTCCFFANDNPADGPEVDLEEMGIVSDNGNPALLLDTGRFTAGQAMPDIDDPEDLDVKKDTTTSGDVTTWGELDLSRDYRISFCVKEASGTRKAQIYVDNNTTSEASSIWGGGGQGSRIFDVPAGDLIPGERVQINVPGDITYEPGGEVKDNRPVLVGTATSFLQFRVEGGSSAIIDDLLVEPQDENGQAELPECTVFQPATAPEAPEAPGLFAGDGQINASWNDVLGAIGYELAYNTTDSPEVASGATVIAAADIEETSHTIEELENGTEYFVFLRVINSVGPGDWSESASATPMAPQGEACVPTLQVDPSPTDGILWNVYDGCTHPGEPGAVVVDGSDSSGSFDFSEEETPFFSVDEQGVMTLDTIGEDIKPVGDLDGVIAGDATTYPKHFTFITRIDTSFAHAEDVRGFEVETHLGDSNERRIKTILRPDDGKIQLERFLSTLEDDGDEETAEVEMDMSDGFHIYQASFEVVDPATTTDNITATIYRDGVQVASFTGNGRDGGNSSSRMRIGEGSSSEFHANVDWLIWSDSATAAGLTAEELVGELPEGIGELDVYAGTDAAAAFEENFNGVGLVEDSDTEDTNFFTAEYRGQSGDSSKPMFNVTSGSSRITVADGVLALHNARFSIGDALHGTDTADTDTSGRGDLDLSEPYVITFDVVENPNASLDSGKCQVYVDNNTTSSGNSLHGGDSKVFESFAAEMADGGQPTGTVTITSESGEDHVGTANSFLQLRCDSGTEDLPVVIDNFKVSYQ